MDRKKRIILGIIFGILILTITGTLAYLTWVKKIGRMVLTIGIYQQQRLMLVHM